jgi:hypothetical protein
MARAIYYAIACLGAPFERDERREVLRRELVDLVSADESRRPLYGR